MLEDGLTLAKVRDRQKRILYVVHRFWPYPRRSERLFYEFAGRPVRAGYGATVFTTNARAQTEIGDIAWACLKRKQQLPENLPPTKFRARH
jgi:hypothetical protein